jgi:hypothetical protein
MITFKELKNKYEVDPNQLIINDRYKKIEKIGDGAQAEVFKVFDLDEKM